MPPLSRDFSQSHLHGDIGVRRLFAWGGLIQYRKSHIRNAAVIRETHNEVGRLVYERVTNASAASNTYLLLFERTSSMANTTDKAIFGAGCFWGVEAAFRQIDGVTATRVGYSGGSTDHPSYKEVCSGRTGHAEVVEVSYDPSKVSYEQLLEVFWKEHDPTQLNRQGPDFGAQYRTAIFYLSDEQQRAAEASKEAQQAHWKRPIVTEITPASTFWEAEDYHQQYLEKRGLATCRIPTTA
jgi:peptide-methionine (S)-S-oxide reductase